MDHYKDWRRRDRSTQKKYAHIVNRTGSAVTDWSLVAAEWEKTPRGAKSEKEAVYVPETVIPPCSDISFPASVTDDVLAKGKVDYTELLRVEFRDDRATYWSRDQRGSLTRLGDNPTYLDLGATGDTPLHASIRSASNCYGESGGDSGN
jgi:hypothetical protein